MSDPAIEPGSGMSYKLLYERLMLAHLDLLRQIRDVLDAQHRPA